MDTASMRTTFAALQPGDVLAVTFHPGSTSPLKTRKVTVTSLVNGDVYVSSGKPWPGNVSGGRLSWYSDAALYYQPTMTQPVRIVHELDRTAVVAVDA